MKISVFGHKHACTRDGGVEVVVTELYRRMGRDHDVTVYDRAEPGYSRSVEADPCFGAERDEMPFHVHRSPTLASSKLNAIMAAFCSTLQCRFSRQDVIHVHAEGPCFFLPLLRGKKIVASVHGLDWQRSKWGGFASWAIKRGEANMARHADEILVLSEQMRRYFADEYGRETRVMPNGVAFHDEIPEAGTLSEIGLEPGGYILYAGRVVPEKRLDLLVQAHADSAVPFKLVIAGKLPDRLPDYLAQLPRPDDVVFAGFCDGNRLAALMAHARLFVLPSDVEGMSLALLEAMSFGTPCLASDIPENVEALGGFGRTFEAGNPVSLAAGLRDAAEAGYERDHAMREHVRARHGWDAVARATEEVLADVARR